MVKYTHICLLYLELALLCHSNSGKVTKPTTNSDSLSSFTSSNNNVFSILLQSLEIVTDLHIL